MAKVVLNILDNNIEYLNKLSNYIFKNHSDKFIIKKYDNLEKINEILNSKLDINEIYLVDEKLISNLFENNNFEIIILSEDSESKNIFKYMSGEKIVEAIIDRYITLNSDAKDILKRNIETEIIGFYSPIGGIGTSSISLAVSEILNKNMETLYISFELNSSFSMFYKDEINLSKLFYYLLSNEEVFIEKIKNNKLFNKQEMLNFISPFNSRVDYNELSEKDIIKFFELLKVHSNFKYIIIDIGNSFERKNLTLLEETDKIVFLGGRKPSDICKIKKFKSDIYKIGKENIINRFGNLFVLNKYKDIEYFDDRELNVLELDMIKVKVNKRLLKKHNNMYKLNIVDDFKKSVIELSEKIKE